MIALLLYLVIVLQVVGIILVGDILGKILAAIKATNRESGK